MPLQLQGLRREDVIKEGLEVYQRLDEGIESKGYLHGPLHPGTPLNVKFRTRDLDLNERRKRFRKVD